MRNWFAGLGAPAPGRTSEPQTSAPHEGSETPPTADPPSRDPAEKTRPPASTWRDLFKKRAAIHEYEAGYDRAIAEHLAYDATIEEWCRQYPQSHDPLLCAGCGQPLGHTGLERPGGAFVHHEYNCMRAHGETRQARAVKALTALGLPPPPGWAQ